ncbi:MAG: galactitol-1-phosphate 5-dehydrogenase [Lachnospiraceae bacterium]|nr:galactitol-1-phosphate 5-dehydrogenase [Lachnospiraceae bacterium]
MKAYVLHGIGDLRYEDVETPILEKETVLVKVRAAGICGSDIPRIYQTGAYSHPLIPGHEFSGEVIETGSGVDNAWLNRRVGIFPMIPCMECTQCRKMQYEMCRQYSYLGSRTDGGFAEYVRVPVWNLLKLPDAVSFEQAAMLEPTAVAVHAARRIQVNPGENAVVCGLGTIGLLLVMILQSMDISDIYVIGNKDMQRRMAIGLGIPAERFCDTRIQPAEDWVKEKTDGEGVDVFFDCAGKSSVLEEAVKCVCAAGRIMLVGNPASDMHLEKALYWKILRRQLTLKGTWNSSYTHEGEDDWHFALNAIQCGRLHPERLITHRFALPELFHGMECMRDKTEEYVKMMGICR